MAGEFATGLQAGMTAGAVSGRTAGLSTGLDMLIKLLTIQKEADMKIKSYKEMADYEYSLKSQELEKKNIMNQKIIEAFQKNAQPDVQADRALSDPTQDSTVSYVKPDGSKVVISTKPKITETVKSENQPKQSNDIRESLLSGKFGSQSDFLNRKQLLTKETETNKNLPTLTTEQPIDLPKSLVTSGISNLQGMGAAGGEPFLKDWSIDSDGLLKPNPALRTPGEWTPQDETNWKIVINSLTDLIRMRNDAKNPISPAEMDEVYGMLARNFPSKASELRTIMGGLVSTVFTQQSPAQNILGGK